MIKKLALALALFAAFSTAAQAQVIATDNASSGTYTDGWIAGDNGGTGFGAWTTVTQGFIGSSTQNGAAPSGGIDTGGVSFALFSNTGAPTLGQAIRPFSTALEVGHTFSLDFDNGFIASGNSQGFSLLSGNTIRFEFYFVGGGTNYTIDGATTQTTAHGFTTDGMSTAFTLTSPDTFTFTITYNTGTPTTETFSGTLDGASGLSIDQFRFFTFNPNQPSNGNNSSTAYFNNPTVVVPEPSSLSLLAGPAILGAWFFVRRRRA